MENAHLHGWNKWKTIKTINNLKIPIVITLFYLTLTTYAQYCYLPTYKLGSYCSNIVMFEKKFFNKNLQPKSSIHLQYGWCWHYGSEADVTLNYGQSIIMMEYHLLDRKHGRKTKCLIRGTFLLTRNTSQYSTVQLNFHLRLL